MRPIIIGAGRGLRLNSMTDNQPKCYARIGDRCILDWMLEAFAGAGLATPVFIGGYKIEQIKNDYPQFTYCENSDWENNNILFSLMHAVDHMKEGFICSYSDIFARCLFRVQIAMDTGNDVAFSGYFFGIVLWMLQAVAVAVAPMGIDA